MEVDTVAAPLAASASSSATLPTHIHHSVNFWAGFVQKCINQRLEPDEFQSFVRFVHQNHYLPPAAIADLFLRPEAANCYGLDPRVPPYLQVLSDLGYINAPAILGALYKYSTSHSVIEAQKKKQLQKPNTSDADGSTDQPNDGAPLRWQNSYWVEEVIFFRLCKSVLQGDAIRDTTTALEVVKVTSKWLALFTDASSAFSADLLNQERDLQLEMETARAAFVPLLLRLTDNPWLLKVISKPVAKDARAELSQNLANFVPTLQLVNSGTEKSITEKLEHFRTSILASLDPADRKKKQAADAAMNEMIDSAVGPDAFEVAEVPIITTRVGMYIYVNAMLVARPTTDDTAFFNYISNRYRGDNQSAAIDIVLASFDVLANAVLRDGGRQDAPLLRSFLINKVPLILCALLPPGFSTASAELCITNALNQVDTSLFPTASLMFDESRNNNPYTESVREEFCAACVLHGLINREHVESILGEMSMSYEPEKKLKERLVQDHQAGTISITDLIGDMEKMDGNAGTVCYAIVELIRRFCNNKDTVALKALCTEMVQKLQSLDVLLLFESLPSVLGPMCQLLEEWRYDEDQTEYQPVYEEFGAILLLVMAFVNRYGLNPWDVGINVPNSRLRKIITQAHVFRPKENLSEQEDKHLNGWILGLFDTEAGGLGDDLMSSCPPQEFYLLIAPLFYNIVIGYSHGYISDESLKGGVEYLVEPFLIPALVPAVHFLIGFLKVNHDERKAVVRVLNLLLLPASISNEASGMLASVKRIISKPLVGALQTYLHKHDPKNEDVNALLNGLKDSVSTSRRTGFASGSEMTEWCRAEPHGLWTSVKNTTQGLMQWAMHPGVSVTPVAYTHRQFILGARMMGPRRLLRMLLEEVRLHMPTDADGRKQGGQEQDGHSGQVAGIVHDVATALICAPDVTNLTPAPNVIQAGAPGQETQAAPLQRILTLSDMLKVEAERCREVEKKDPVLAEIVVRLHRRVEAQMEQLSQPPPGMMGGAGDMTSMDMGAAGTGMDMGAGTGMDMGAGADVSLDAMAAMQGDGGVGLDISLDGLGGTGTGADGDVGGDADLFGGLDADLDATLDGIDWGEGMDLS